MKGEDYNNSNFVQCQCCGNTYMIKTEKEIPVESLIIKSLCPKCGHINGLNCGKSKDDIYRFINLNIDNRYYEY